LLITLGFKKQGVNSYLQFIPDNFHTIEQSSVVVFLLNMNRFPLLHLVAFFIFLYQPAFSAKSAEPKADSALNLSSSFEQLSARTKVAVARELINSRNDFNAHQAVLQQGRTFAAVKNELERARNFLRQGYSYHEIKDEIDKLTLWKKLAGEGVITGKDKFQTVRNLAATSI
jgi:hypothetical protein